MGRSLIYMRNKRGASTDPWGTPDVTGRELERLFLIETNWERLVRNAVIHARMLGCKFSWESFSNRRLCGTVSNALAKSRKIASV